MELNTTNEMRKVAMLHDLLNKIIRHLIWLFQSFRDFIKYLFVIDSNTLLFVSHNGDSAGGAPVVLVELLKSITKDNKVVLLCIKPGDISKICEQNNIRCFNCYIIGKLFIRYAIYKKVRLIFANTVATVGIINYLIKINCKLPVFWWIHEEKLYMEKYKGVYPNELPNNYQILSVSENVKNDLIQINKSYTKNHRVFYYGCEDLYECNEYIYHDKYLISVIGRICKRKNQLQIKRAYDLLSNTIKQKITVQFIYASYDENYMKELQKQCKNNTNFLFRGKVDRKDMKNVYRESGIIICCSVDDPLPVVVTEAMMMKCPYITSSRTGQYSLVKNGVNGYSYDVTSDKDLVVYFVLMLADILLNKVWKSRICDHRGAQTVRPVKGTSSGRWKSCQISC